MEAKFGCLEKSATNGWHRSRLNFSETRPSTPFFFYQKRNEEILEELKVEAIYEKLKIHKSKWLRHVTRINSNRMAKIIKNYRLNRQRRLGRHLKRQLDEAETGLSRPNWWWW